MGAGETMALCAALAFAFTNGVNDASNAVAALVATRAGRPLPAVIMAAVFNMLGPLVVGTAVAGTVGGIVTVDGDAAIEVIGAGLIAAVAWNSLMWWRGLPSSSGHALVGGLVGASLAEGGTDAINWGGLNGIHPVGVFGTLAALAIAPVSGSGRGARDPRFACRARAGDRANGGALPRRRVGDLSGTRVQPWLQRRAEVNRDGGRLARRRRSALTLLTTAVDGVVVCGDADLGTLIGGWRIMRTVGRGIYRIAPLEGLSSQSASPA